MLSLWPALRASALLLRARPVVTLSLGAAVVLSLLSVCCGGVGLITTPWFMCELFALQLYEAGGQPIKRQLSWMSAGSVLLGAVLLVSSVAWLTLLGASPELATEVPHAASLSALMKSGGFFSALGSAIALLFILPFLYCPLILIEERARFDAALLESARRVASGGALKHAGFSLMAHTIQVAPAALAATFSLIFDPSVLPLAVVWSAPLLAASVPLGQGMIVCAYMERQRAQAAADGGGEPSKLARDVRLLTGRYAFSWLTLVMVPLVSLIVLGISLVRPSHIAYGKAKEGTQVAELRPLGTHAVRVVLPDTALEVAVDMKHVRIAASDGGGAGELPLRDRTKIDAVRVLRVRDAYAIEITQGDKTALTFVDRAGVRLDDDLRVRLFDRVPGYALIFMLFTLLCTALFTLPVLDALARVRHGYALPEGRRPSDDLLALDLERSLSRTRRSALLLTPLIAATAYVAWLGLGLS